MFVQVGCDYAGMRYGGNGTFSVEAPVVYIDDPCSAEGWAASPLAAGDIALVAVSGGAASLCSEAEKGLLADDFEAGAVVFQSSSAAYPGGRVYDSSTWGTGERRVVQVPCVGASNALGQLLRQPGTVAAITVSNKVEVYHTYNVIATSKPVTPLRACLGAPHSIDRPRRCFGPALRAPAAET